MCGRRVMALWTVASTVGQTPCLKLCRVRIKFNHDSTCPCFFKCCSLERYTTVASVVTGRRSLSVADYRRERRPREGHGEIPTFYFVEKMKITGFRLVTGEKTISSSQVVHVVFLFFYSAFRVGGKMLRRCGQQVKAGHWVSLAVTG